MPIPSSGLLIRLAREFPSVYGWIKEETGGADANARMRAECRAPEVKTVFSAWGSYGWLDQHRRFGTRVFSPDEIAAIEDRLSRLAP